MFLDRSWPIRGGAADIYVRTVTEKFHINEVFYLFL